MGVLNALNISSASESECKYNIFSLHCQMIYADYNQSQKLSQYINSQKIRLNSVKIKHSPILCAKYTKMKRYFCELRNKMYIDCWPRIW